jgi:hypothetical protein
MNLPREFTPVKPRLHRKRRATVDAAAPPPAALAVVGAVVFGIIGPEIEVNVAFNTTADEPLNDPSAADPSKWTARYQGQMYVGVLVGAVDFETMYLQMTPTGAQAGPDVISYANAPSDIADALGRQLAAFGGFPL